MKNQITKEQVVEYINKNTHREDLEEKTTKEVAMHFGIDIKIAYALLCSVSDKKNGTREITHLDPVNGEHFDCCGWIRNNDDNEK